MSMTVTLTKSFKGDQLRKAGHKLLAISLYQVGRATLEKAKELCPKRYGYLGASLNMMSRNHGIPVNEEDKSIYAQDIEPENRIDFIIGFHNIERPSEWKQINIGTALSYAWAVEFGSRPHTIKIVNKKALSDMTNFYGTEVHHPGHEAQPFLRPALDWAHDNFANIIFHKGGLKFDESFIDKAGEDGEFDEGEV